MQIIGIDPAPSKGLHIFDGEDRHVPLRDARSYLDSLQSLTALLICWDSPLTGPSTDVVEGAEAHGQNFTQRGIESFFRRASTGYKTPKGISVLGYAGCPHWAMSRSLLGLPRVGPYDVSEHELPFKLATRAAPTEGRHVVEVHPAVAIWAWLEESLPGQDWTYKKDHELAGRLWTALLDGPWRDVPAFDGLGPPADDDALDARTAYALGYLWTTRPEGQVENLGDGERGAFLLPVNDGMRKAFARFVRAGQ